MEPPTLVTYLDTVEAFDWGLRLDAFRGPTVVLAHPRLAGDLSERETGDCEIVYRTLPGELGFGDALSAVCDLYLGARLPTDHAVFCEARLLYKSISFDLAYRGLLWRALQREGLLHHNLTRLTRSTGILFTLTRSGAEDARARLQAQPSYWASGIGPDPTQQPLPVVEPDAEDVNLVAIPEIDGRTLHLVGDSHAWLMLTPNPELGARSHVFLDLRRYSPEAPFDYQFTHHLGSRTMYGFSREAREGDVTLARFGVRPGDAVVFVLGEIDVRSHVFKHVDEARPLPQVIRQLTAGYFAKLETLTAPLRIGVVVMGAIPPMDGPNYRSKDYPIRGSLAQRVTATRLLNASLAEGCRARGYTYFEVNDLYALPDGALDVTQSDYFCHVGHHHQGAAIARMLEVVRSVDGEPQAAEHV